MYPEDLEELIKWYLSTGSCSYVLESLQRISIESVMNDEVEFTVEYGSNYLYRDEFIFTHTEMILAYINSRFEELSPTLN